MGCCSSSENSHGDALLKHEHHSEDGRVGVKTVDGLLRATDANEGNYNYNSIETRYAVVVGVDVYETQCLHDITGTSGTVACLCMCTQSWHICRCKTHFTLP